MKKILFVFVLLLNNISSVFAQYSSYNSFSRKAIVCYQRDDKGYYQRIIDKMLDQISGVTKIYAYDKKAQNLYVMTENSNCVVTLNKDYAKIVKNNDEIPQMKGEELDKEVQVATKSLDDKYTQLNKFWAKHLRDSIAKVESDSINAVLQCQNKIKQHNEMLSNYRKLHRWNIVPLEGHTLTCGLCNKSFSEDSALCMGIKKDSIYYFNRDVRQLGIICWNFHVCKIPTELAEDATFRLHCEAFKDSLNNNSEDLTREKISLYNYLENENYIKNIKKKAPYGFFNNWGWNNEYSMLTFNFSYTNTYPKTIRYIDVYFKLTNDVNDVRLVGHFKGTGPLKQFESARWNWDSSRYFTSGDASKMSFTKVILTFMDGKQKVLTGRLIQDDNDDSDTGGDDE